MKAFRLLNFLASLKDLEPGKVKDVWLKLVKDLEVHRDNEMLILEVYDHDTFGKVILREFIS